MAQQTEERIDVRQAIAKAREYIKLVMAGEPLDRLMLEGVELSYDEKNWIITFGFEVMIPPRFGLEPGRFRPEEYERVYRDIYVDAVTGKAHSMKPRIVWTN